MQAEPTPHPSASPTPSPARGEGKLIALGVFGAPQGVRGEVRIKSYTRDPKAIAAYGPLTDGRGARFVLESVRLLKDEMLVARLEGIANREAAAALTGVELFARREQLPPPDEDEFYYDDLVGLAAVSRDGRAARPGRRIEQLRRGRHSRNQARGRRRVAAAAVHQGGGGGDRFSPAAGS